jgi:hypothetical protein
MIFIYPCFEEFLIDVDWDFADSSTSLYLDRWENNGTHFIITHFILMYMYAYSYVYTYIHHIHVHVFFQPYPALKTSQCQRKAWA